MLINPFLIPAWAFRSIISLSDYFQKLKKYGAQDNIELSEAIHEERAQELKKYFTEKDIIKYRKIKSKKNSVQYIEACKKNKWSILLKNKKTGKVYLKHFRCHSWRHKGKCAEWRGAFDFVRIRNALTSTAEKHGQYWTYLMITYEHKESIYKSYIDIYKKWSILRKRIQYHFGDIKYICIIEQHKSEYPHLNVIIHNKEISDTLAGVSRDNFKDHAGFKFMKKWLTDNYIDTGHGKISWVEPVRNSDAMAGYIVKLSKELTKGSQLPVAAPRGFRRLRCSQGLLEKKYTAENKDITGSIIRVNKVELLKYAVFYNYCLIQLNSHLMRFNPVFKLFKLKNNYRYLLYNDLIEKKLDNNAEI